MDRTFEEYKEIIEKYLLDFIPNVDNKSLTIYEAMKYSLTAGGKRIRPILTLAACEFANGNHNDALPYAIAIEYIHTYSLIHDDLPCMDNDDLRRGKPTNHKVYGEAIATLCGDGLLNTAFEAISRDMSLYFDNPTYLIPRTKAFYEIAKGAGVRGMIAGQVCDIEGENGEYSNEMLNYLHLNKTGALIKAAIKVGLYFGKPTEDMLDRFDKYAECLGLAYQVRDDILDVVGNEKELGKSIGKDKKENKNTYVSLIGLEESYKKLDELLDEALSSISVYYDNAEFFKELIEKLRLRRK